MKPKAGDEQRLTCNIANNSHWTFSHVGCKMCILPFLNLSSAVLKACEIIKY